VCHSRVGLLASAKAVNGHLAVQQDDQWLCALPLFHVGGFCIYARAFASNSGVFELSSPWTPQVFIDECERCGATLSALVPTQVYDLVRGSYASPKSLRAVLVGGGGLAADLEARARGLGWPILRTYGLSEAGSQVATQGGEDLQVLPHLETAYGLGGKLKLRGESMLSGYLQRISDHTWNFEDVRDEHGWFQTDDIVALQGDVLRFIARDSSRFKVFGEMVDVDALEAKVLAMFPAHLDLALIDVPDPRTENALVLAVAANLELDTVEPLVEVFNASVAGFERIKRVLQVGRIPRGELGKVRRAALRQKVIEAEK
jgi:O-succinylbenzoic acid--CoA ligase